MAVIVALMATLLMSVLGAALVLTTSSDALIASNFRNAQKGVYAADAALGIAMNDLASMTDWDPILSGSTQSTFVDGSAGGVRRLADGSSLDLDRTVNMMNCQRATACSASSLTAITAQRPWGANNPVWRLFVYGPLSNLSHLASDNTSYVLVMVADDSSENDGDPLHDGAGPTNPGSGILSLRAEAFGPQATRQVVELTFARPPTGQAVPEILSWRLIR